VQRSITQPEVPDGAAEPEGLAASDWASLKTMLKPAHWGLILVFACLLIFANSQPNKANVYLHFVFQAQSWMDGDTSIPTHVQGSTISPGDNYQDIMPILDSNGTDTNRGVIPFPPLPAWVLLPFVAIWHLWTNEQLIATVFSAIDVGIAFWMLGFLPVRPQIRWFTALFLGLGTVLWYSAAIGSTWFWAHIVAVGCLLLAVGLALSVDREAAEPRPVSEALPTLRKFVWPGGWRSFLLLAILGAAGVALLKLADSGVSAASLTALGVFMGLVAAGLAAAVAGRASAIAPIVVAVAVVAGMPALLIAGAHSSILVGIADVVLVVAIVALVFLAGRAGSAVDRALDALSDALSRPESVQIAAGLLFGLAVTARLTILMGFPFFLLVGGGGTWLRRGMLAGAGAAVPLTALLVFTYASTGHVFNPAYDYLYHVELGYTFFNYHPEWSITDIRYIPQNLGIMFGNLPRFMPAFNSVFPVDTGQEFCTAAGSARSLLGVSCPIAVPDAIGTSILVTSPAYLFALVAWRPSFVRKLDRATVGASLAVILIAVVNLMHFSQGWVQFGYRFSNDFVPFALILVALGASRIRWLWPFVVLVVASVLVNLWGVYWGVSLGW
jgi:hypothetical protein